MPLLHSLIKQVYDSVQVNSPKSRSAGLGDVYMLLANTFGVQGHWCTHSLASLKIEFEPDVDDTVACAECRLRP